MKEKREILKLVFFVDSMVEILFPYFFSWFFFVFILNLTFFSWSTAFILSSSLIESVISTFKLVNYKSPPLSVLALHDT